MKINSKATSQIKKGDTLIEYVKEFTYQGTGRIQEFWLGGGGDFFLKALGLGVTFRPPMGPGQCPDGGPGGEAPGNS